MLRNTALALCLFALGSYAAHADTVLTSGSYTEFTFAGFGSGASGNAYTFTGPGVITVLDGFDSGDEFSVFDGTTLLGDTSTPVGGAYCGADTTACYANLDFSRGNFVLGAGPHSINVAAALSPFGVGAAFIGLNVEPAPAVPEPSSLALLATGLVGIASTVRRKLRN